MVQEVIHRNALLKGSRLNEYIIEKVLGKPGGFGVAYLARDTNLDQWVAIKEYLPNDLAMREGATVHPKSTHDEGDFEWGLERFRDEAKTLAKFVHPNVVQVLRYFEANSTGYMVMRYEDGLPLNEILEKETLTEDELVQNILLPLLDGLKQVHAAGFLHRDIKPGNIYMRRSDETPVLLDFGAARNALGSKSKSLTSIVTAGYAPFEQYHSDGNQGPWSDIYALGAVAYRIVTGERPPEAPSRIRKDKMIPAVEAAQGKYSQPLLQAIDHALAMDEEDRPQNCEEWKRELTAQTSAEPSTAELSPESEFQAKNWFIKLIRGHYGLSKTYWRFGGAIFGLLIIDGVLHRNNKLLGEFLLTALMGMAIIVTVGVWKASGKYTGKKFWSGLAKITSVVFLLLLGQINYIVLGNVPSSSQSKAQINTKQDTVTELKQRNKENTRIPAEDKVREKAKLAANLSVSVASSGPAAFSADSSKVVWANGNTIKLTDIRSQKTIREFVGHKDRVELVSLSPSGKLLLSGSYDKFVKIWSYESGDFLGNIAEYTDNGVAAIAFSPDDSKVISAGYHDRSFNIFDFDSGQIQTVREASASDDWLTGNPEYSITINPMGTRILTGIQAKKESSLKLWSMEGKLLRYFKFKDVSDWEKKACAGIDEDGIVVHSISFNPDGSRALVTVGYANGTRCVDETHPGVFENTIYIFDVAKGEQISRLTGNFSEVLYASFNADGSKVVSGNVDGDISIWDYPSGELERTFNYKEVKGQVSFVILSPDSSILVSQHQGVDSSLIVHNLKTKKIFKLN